MEFEIKHEGLPERCDVCHQADMFDPQTNQCQRCQRTGNAPESVRLIASIANHGCQHELRILADNTGRYQAKQVDLRVEDQVRKMREYMAQQSMPPRLYNAGLASVFGDFAQSGIGGAVGGFANRHRYGELVPIQLPDPSPLLGSKGSFVLGFFVGQLVLAAILIICWL